MDNEISTICEVLSQERSPIRAERRKAARLAGPFRSRQLVDVLAVVDCRLATQRFTQGGSSGPSPVTHAADMSASEPVALEGAASSWPEDAGGSVGVIDCLAYDAAGALIGQDTLAAG